MWYISEYICIPSKFMYVCNCVCIYGYYFMAHGNYRCRYNKLPLNLLFVVLIVDVVVAVVVMVVVVVFVVLVTTVFRDRVLGLASGKTECPAASSGSAAPGSSHVLSLISFIKKDNEPVAVRVSHSLSLFLCLCVNAVL